MAWILTSLQGLAKGLECRIKVVCDQTSQHDGYISRTLDETGSHVVTQTAEDALTIFWDPTSAGPTALEMINNTQNQRWLALRFKGESPNLKRDRVQWATFTAASGTEHDYKVVPTPWSPGKELIITWTWSDGNLTANALGETLEAGLNLDLNPPHLFFCHRMKNYWANIKRRFAVRFVLEPLEPKD
ncbi:hypothetical protein FRC04_009150 [Tulasnella sp. 424]|nr:hypothetical protein FRC04_009150 [Tulasnella sp. 424]